MNVIGCLNRPWKKDGREGVICKVYAVRRAEQGELGQIPEEFYAKPEAIQGFDGQGEYQATLDVRGGDRPRVEVLTLTKVKR